VLAREDDDGQTHQIAEGRRLVAKARSHGRRVSDGPLTHLTNRVRALLGGLLRTPSHH
jgi:hypothetical protein